MAKPDTGVPTMSYYAPIVERGIGRVSGRALNAVVDSAEWTRERRDSVDRLLAATQPDSLGTFLARVTSATLLSANRWTYTLEHHDLTAAVASQAHADTAITSFTAYNLYEIEHSATGALGDGSVALHIPAGFAVVPVSGIVLVHLVRATDASILYMFDRACGIDGVCA